MAPLFSFNPLYRLIKNDFSGLLALENLAKANELYDLVKNHSFEQSSITIPSENLRIKRGVPIFKVSKTNVYDEDGREEMNFLRDQIVDETDVVQLNPTEQNTARAMRLDELSEEVVRLTGSPEALRPHLAGALSKPVEVEGGQQCITVRLARSAPPPGPAVRQDRMGMEDLFIEVTR